MLVLVSSRQFQIFIRCLLCFLYETVQEHHSIPLINVEQDPSNPIVCEMSSDFIDSLTHGSTRWHSNWPAELYGLDVLSDSLPVLRIWQRLEPLSNRLATAFGSIEDCRDALAGLCCIFCVRAIALPWFLWFLHRHLSVPYIVHRPSQFFTRQDFRFFLPSTN